MLDFTREFKEVKIFTGVFWYFFTMFAVIFIAILSNNESLYNNDNLLSLISSSLFIIILLYKFRISKNKIILLIKDYLKKLNLKEISGVVLTQIILSMGISSLLIAITYYTFPEMLNSLLEESPIAEASTYQGLIISMLITVICAPISEELLFRSIIFKRTSGRFNIYIGMIFSSIIFGILHIELAIIGAFIFGIACCMLYIKYKNILIPMTVHFLNNLLSFLPELFNDPTVAVESTPFTESDAVSFLIMGSISFLIGMFFFVRFVIKNKEYLKSGFASRNKEAFTSQNS